MEDSYSGKYAVRYEKKRMFAQIEMNSYAGIGSRNISSIEQNRISKTADLMCSLGYVLYSGHADGSDISFERSCDGFGISFLPWKNFNKDLISPTIKTFDISDNAFESVSKFHPYPGNLTSAGRMLMARNYHQVCGNMLVPIVDYVIFCADEKNGNVIGGTGQAVRIARSLGIQCINLRGNDWKEALKMIPEKKMVDKEELIERVI